MTHFKTLCLVPVAALFLAACSGTQENASPASASPAPQNTPATPQPTPAVRPVIQTYEIVATYPHDAEAFTQGLFFWDGALYESTGRYEQSSVRKTEIETGKVSQIRDLPPEYFGEGITRWKDKIIALTWLAGTGFIIDLETFSPIDAFDYPGEGWGITANETELIQSDGSSVLRFLDPETFQIKRTLKVNLNGKPLTNINELEWIDGEIWANVWQSDLIARIDSGTGHVLAVIDFSNLFPPNLREDPNDDVLNGIAHDPETGRLFVTGKHWPNLYEVRVETFSPPAN